MFPKELNLRDLVNLEEWQRIQDSFAEALEVTLRLVSLDGEWLSGVSRPNRLCNKILPNTPFYAESSAHCILKTDAANFREIKEEVNFKCPFGLDLFAVPITAVGEKIVAHAIVGPLMLKRRKEAAEYAQQAQKLGVKLENLMDALIEINVFSYNKIHSINKLIKNSFSYIARSGYHKKRLGEMAPEIREMDPLFSRYYEEKILSSLLNACSLAFDTDSGSVMTLDKKTEMLHIQVASKLSEDIVHNTNIKLGEGIAGLAAQTAEPIILPKDGLKNGLAQKMKRGYIKSSMIVPFSRPFDRNGSHDVYGVINLNIVRKERSFSEKDIALVQELINLVSLALLPVQQPPSPENGYA